MLFVFPVLTYKTDLYINKNTPKGKRHNTNRLYPAAAVKSSLKSDINIRVIPQPGQYLSVIR